MRRVRPVRHPYARMPTRVHLHAQVRYPVVEPSEAWNWEDRRWHIDGDTGRIDTHQSVVVLPMVTPIAAGGGGTALLKGSHHAVARWLHDFGEWGVGNHRRIRTIVEKGIEREGISAVVEATGAAGDVLLMHPLLIHAVNDARRVTFHLSSEPGAAARWTAVQHGIRVTFNLSTHWARMPLIIPDWDDGRQPRSVLEHSLVAPIAEGMQRNPNRERVLIYGEVVEMRFVESGMMLGVHGDYEGLAFASSPRIPARSVHDLRFHAPGRQKGGAGLPVCYGDELVIKCRGESGSWNRLGVSPVRDLDAKARAALPPHATRPSPPLVHCRAVRRGSVARPPASPCPTPRRADPRARPACAGARAVLAQGGLRRLGPVGREAHHREAALPRRGPTFGSEPR